MLESVRLDLPEVTWSVSSSIVTYHHWGRRGRIAVECIINVLDILLYSVYTIRPTMVGC